MLPQCARYTSVVTSETLNEISAAIYMVSTGSDGLGLWVSSPSWVPGADRDVGGAYRFPYREKVVPSGSNRFSWRRWVALMLFRGFLARGKLVFCV